MRRRTRGKGVLQEFVEAQVLPARRGRRMKKMWWWNPPKFERAPHVPYALVEPPPVEKQTLFFPEPVVIPWGMS